MSLPFSRRALLVAICWIQLIAAALLQIMTLVTEARGPYFGVSYTPGGVVLSTDAGEAAARTGLRRGDVIVALNERAVDRDTPLFYDVNAGDEVRVAFRRGGTLHTAVARPRRRLDAQIAAYRSGEATWLTALNDAARLLANVVVLSLAVMLLRFRPELGAARVAAITLASFVGGNGILYTSGFGAMWPAAIAIPAAIVDIIFYCSFFALQAHFALLFPRPFRAVRANPALQLVPYAVVFPLLIVSFGSALRFYAPGTALPAMHGDIAFITFGPLLAISGIVLLALHYRDLKDRNERRRLTLVIFSLLPAVIGWIAYLAVAEFSESVKLDAIALALRWIGVIGGASLFAYAIARYRVFDIRLIVRKSIRYALARGTLLFLISLPAVALLLFLYTRRRESLLTLFDQHAAQLLGLVAVSIVLFRSRQRIFDRIDRQYFRESYDARVTLLRVTGMLQRGTDIFVVGRVALNEIHKALHPRVASMWLRDASDCFTLQLQVGELLDDAPPLAAESLLQSLADGAPVAVDEGQARRRLTADTRWLRAVRPALAVPIVVDESLFGLIVLGERKSEEPYATDEVELLRAIAAQLALTADYGRLETLARRDALTEALNRHAFYSIVERRRGTREESRGCVALVDLNGLKIINDTHGHAAGDDAIRRVAGAIRGVIRADDLLFRWGGDEFLVVLFGLSTSEATNRFARLNAALSDGVLPVTVSFGVAPFTGAEEISGAIDAADHEMYAQKRVVGAQRAALSSGLPT